MSVCDSKSKYIPTEKKQKFHNYFVTYKKEKKTAWNKNVRSIQNQFMTNKKDITWDEEKKVGTSYVETYKKDATWSKTLGNYQIGKKVLIYRCKCQAPTLGGQLWQKKSNYKN